MTDTDNTPAPGLALNVPASFPGAVRNLADSLAQLADKCRPGYCVSKGFRDQIEECHAVASAAVFAIENQPVPAPAAASQSLPPAASLKWDHDGQGGYYVEMRVNSIRSESQAHAAMAYMERLFCGAEQPVN